MRVWLLCRSSLDFEEYILNYQKNILTEYANRHHYKIVGGLKEVSYEKNLDTFGMRALISEINKHSFDLLLVTSKSRICSKKDILDEFELFCNSCGVTIIEVQNL